MKAPNTNWRALALTLAAAFWLGGAAQAAEIRVMISGGLTAAFNALVPEFERQSGNKVLVTCRVEQTIFEDLTSNFFGLTVAHQWIWSSFQMRLGVGARYFVMTGTDLDGESLNQAGWLPASDIAFYWRF